MKTIMLVMYVAMMGCAGNTDALKARAATAETENARLTVEAKQMRADSDTCVAGLTKLHNLETYLQTEADKAWIAIKEREAAAEPVVKQTASDGIDSVEQAITNAAAQAADATRAWAVHHNFVSK
jgi:hypothetical protein